MDGDVMVEADQVTPKKLSRYDRMKRRIGALAAEVESLDKLSRTLLGHLETAIQPDITDADRIRYRCMIEDIREELQGTHKAASQQTLDLWFRTSRRNVYSTP